MGKTYKKQRPNKSKKKAPRDEKRKKKYNKINMY